MANEEKYLKPIHPGEILLEDFMKPLKLSQNRLAREIAVPPRRINEIIHGKRAVTADTAMQAVFSALQRRSGSIFRRNTSWIA